MPYANQIAQLDSAGNYSVGTVSQVWINPVILTSAAPLTSGGTVTVTTAAPALATTIACAALTRAIAKNQPIINAADTQCFYADAPAAVGATSITVKPLKSAIAINSTFPYFTANPYFSASEATLKFDGETQEWRNFGASDFSIQARTKIKTTFDINGNVVKGDPAMPLLLTAMIEPDRWVQVTYVSPDDIFLQFEAYVNSGEVGSKVDDPLMRPFSFLVSSDIVRRNAKER
jgi:hypothetical protein